MKGVTLKQIPQMSAQIATSYDRATAANVARHAKLLDRVLKLAIGGATTADIAKACKISREHARDCKTELRQAGRLGCCMHPGCRLSQERRGLTLENGDCRWLIK